MDNPQEQLKNILQRMSNIELKYTEKDINNFIKELQRIYQNGFRHLYSDIFHTITLIDNADNKKYSLESLNLVIKEIYNVVSNGKEYNEDFCLSIKKLYDHINLDIGRIEYTKKIAEKINAENLKTKEELNTIATKAEKMQKEYITILGIFSSIVITFVAGMSFSSSVLSNIDKTSINRLSFVMVMLAIFLFNFLHLLLDFIRKINNNPTEPPPNKNTSLIGGINVVLFIMLIIILTAWYCGFHPYKW